MLVKAIWSFYWFYNRRDYQRKDFNLSCLHADTINARGFSTNSVNWWGSHWDGKKNKTKLIWTVWWTHLCKANFCIGKKKKNKSERYIWNNKNILESNNWYLPSFLKRTNLMSVKVIVDEIKTKNICTCSCW